MHPEVKSEKPGRCPECGMNLVPSKRAGPADAKAMAGKHSTKMFLRKFWVSLILTIPIVAVRIFDIKISGVNYAVAILGSIIFFYGGLVFLRGAIMEIRAKLPGMMTLIGLAVSAAYTYSVFTTIFGGETLFWELATLITVMLLGHWLEMRSVSSTQGALKELSKLLPDKAELADGRTIPIAELQVGDILLVRPGGRIPADGVVKNGESDANESMITGESAPVPKKPGSEVIAGTINGDGSLKIEVTKIGEKTFLAGVMRLVAEAQASKSRLQILSDRAAFYLTLIAVFGGLITFAFWLAVKGDAGFAVTRLVAVLVIACPHALGLAVPLVASISTTLAAQHGFLVKQRLALEAARNVDVVLFDKTGTLTKGAYGVTNVWGDVLGLAASVDAQSEHFISRAIVAKAKEEKIKLSEVKDFQRIPGRGVKGSVGNKEILVGGEAILDYAKAKTPEDLQKIISAESAKGKTIIYVVQKSDVVGAIALADIIREESKEAVVTLKKLGVKTAMITGDSEPVAKWVAGELGIDEYFAKVLPEEKTAKVKILQERGQKVAMVGDGINDAPALTQADLGIAIGAGTNVAIESAGIILIKNDPRDIVKIIRLSQLTYSKMMQNLFWATGYNIVALPLAAGVLFTYGILLQPALAALFMSVSTVIVAINAILLKNKRLV